MEVHPGKLILKYRLAMGWSQRTLALKAGMTTKQIKQIELGQVFPTENEMWQIANALDVEVSEIQSEEKISARDLRKAKVAALEFLTRFVLDLIRKPVDIQLPFGPIIEGKSRSLPEESSPQVSNAILRCEKCGKQLDPSQFICPRCTRVSLE